jgi:pilus assembly protein Flp/PilA
MGLALTEILGYIMTTPGSPRSRKTYCPMRTQPEITQARGFASGEHLPGASVVNSHHAVEAKSMMALARKFWNDESGQGLAEYALLLGLIVIGVVVLIQGMGVSIQKIFNKANADLTTAASKIS